MTDLPSQTPSNAPQPGPEPQPVSSGISKEVEWGMSPQAGSEPAVPLKDIGIAEVELPKEVSAVGVQAQPTTVQVPPQVQQQGVKPVGDISAQAQTPAVALPLTDDQIAQGLSKGVKTSWRWLAEWCKRRLKQVHLALKNVHGKITRVKQ